MGLKKQFYRPARPSRYGIRSCSKGSAWFPRQPPSKQQSRRFTISHLPVPILAFPSSQFRITSRADIHSLPNLSINSLPLPLLFPSSSGFAFCSSVAQSARVWWTLADLQKAGPPTRQARAGDRSHDSMMPLSN